ncbi:MAG: site-specific DNA-methyltransferase [Ignavibacterium sp.]|nr:site-specific DNA-methyltransferase [Ignavibacterium sp.]MCX7610064.1 site-specific DNA-methyltransferase [Ignavibacterium sp.]MDW8374457.1 site-specific DNA-methyltransferase [Ignavibacteriales bacterium]
MQSVKKLKREYFTELNQNNILLENIKQDLIDSDKIYLEYKNILLVKSDVLDENLFKKEFIDLIVTSPPYNVDIKYNSHKDNLTYDEYLEFSEKWIRNCYKWSKPQARFLLNCPLDKNKGGQQSVGADLTLLAKKIGWKYHSTIIWNEGNISRRTAWGSWLSASAPFVIAPVELIIVFYKESWKKEYGSGKSDISKEEFMEWTNGLWNFNGESKKRIGHPAPFPRELPKRCIKLFSFVDDIIFDPFVGSGTTLIEAANNNRFGIGVEVDEKYCRLAKKRILNEVQETFL